MELYEVVDQYQTYPLGAYVMIYEVLDWVFTEGSEQGRQRGHLTGQELAQKVFLFSVGRYGLLGRMIWEELNISTSEDVGEIVYHLVDNELMGKQDTDRKEDFEGLFTIDDFDQVVMRLKGDRAKELEVEFDIDLRKE